jgi:uncharacterized protein (TIGR03118 family)
MRRESAPSPTATDPTTSQRSRRRWHPALMLSVTAAGLLAAGAPALAATAAAGPAAAGTPAAAANDFTQTNLIASSASFHAKLTDPNLTNAWGLAAAPNMPLWVSDNNSGDATVYSGGIGGGAVKLDLTVPVPGGNPSGQVYNSDSSAFPVGGSSGSPALFIVDTDSIGSQQSPGEIAAWDGGAKFVVEDSPAGGAGGKTPAKAVFKGLAIATSTKAGPELFAADLANATVDVFGKDFNLLSTPTEFRDPYIPLGYAPYGIQNLGGKIYVAYGKQNAQKTNVVTGSGLGYVDVYSTNGQLLRHLITGGTNSPLNAPWGLAIAPKTFGPFGGDLLVGNLGNGWINAFDPTTGGFLGTLDGSNGYPITINGLWGLQVGNSAFGGPSALVFSSGPDSYNDGLVGTLTPASGS